MTPAYQPVLPPGAPAQYAISAESSLGYRRLVDIYHECVLREGPGSERAVRAYSLMLRSGKLDWATDWREALRNIVTGDDEGQAKASFLRETLDVHLRPQKRGSKGSTTAVTAKREVSQKQSTEPSLV